MLVWRVGRGKWFCGPAAIRIWESEPLRHSAHKLDFGEFDLDVALLAGRNGGIPKTESTYLGWS